MEADDLAALLEQELGLLDDEDDNDEFDLDLTLFDRSATENVDTVVNDEDMNLLLLSASTLSALNVELSVSVPLEPEVEAEPKADLAVSSQVQEIISIQPYTFKDPEELTEEQKLVIADLMELMIESVERCAPILERTELAALQSTETIPSADHNIPIIINDELQANIVLEDIASEHPSHEIGLIDEKLVIESKIRKEELITAAQQSDQLVWEESRRYKEALEQERIRLEERKLRREQARLAALREKATENLQRLYRGHTARKAYKSLLTARMSELARLEAERLHQQQLQEEALRRERLLRERENEQRERAQMALAEQQCRSVWEEMKRLVEARRLDEQWCMQAEDALSAAVREAVHQAKVKMQSYIALAAQEDVEYDLGNYGSDSDCDTMSDWEGEETPPQGAYLDTSRSISAAPPAAASAVSVAASPVVKPVPPSMPATMPGPVVTRTLRAAPAKAKPVVSVDPTQGKKWGGSISTAWNSISGSAEPAAPSNDGGGAYGESAVEGTPGGVTVVETQLLPPPRSAAEQRELETHWQQLVRQGAQICARSIDFAPTSVAKAQALFDTLLYKGGKSTPIENKHSKPPLIQALRHWQAYWSEQQLQHQQLKTRAASLSASGNPHEKKKEHNNNKQTTTAVTLTPARDLENEKALQNSMVDLETDPLLAKELDFCVEGLFSTNFLHQFKNLSKLAINVNKISELNGLRDLSMLLHISAKDNRISSVEALGNLKQLRFLYLDSNKLTDLSPLDGLDQLVVLTANSNSLTEFPCLECVSLQRLELCRNRIPSIPAHALWGVPNLNHLNLSSNQLTEVSGHALSACGSLQTLILSENQLSAVPAPLRLPLLKNLRLNLNRITNLEAWKHQDQSGDGGDSESSSVWPFFAPSLQKLVLSDNQISSLADVFCLLPLLEELDLSFNALAAQEAVEGIRQCKLLTALHVQDNLFTTVPVNTGGAAGTSRTALPAPQQAALNQWLCALCPNLETISGNRLDKVEFAEAHLQRRPGQILTHYSQYRTWLPPDFNVQDLYYQHDSMECRQLIHLLQAHHHSQNTMAVKERAVKKDEVAANKSHSKRVNSTSAEQAKVVPAATRNWESELSNLLTMQREQLLRRGCEPEGALDNTIHNKSVVFVSYKKATPGVISLDQITSTTPVLVAEVADPRMFGATKVSGHDAESSRSSKPRPNYNSNEVNFIALSMQKRFRGRRVRQRLGNALQSFRYKDNELDDLFAGEEFNFEQEMADLSFLDSHDDAPAVMVYGDHIRKRSRPTSSVKASQPASAPVVANANMADSTAHLSSNLLLPLPTANHWILPEDDRNSPPKQSQGAGAVSGPGGGVRTGAGAYGVAATTSNFYRQQQPLNDSRPGTGMTSVSSISAHTTDAPDASASALLQSGANSPAASRSALSSRSEGPQDMQHDQASTMSSARRSNRATAAVLAQEWGISDPKVLATMIKRNQRIRHFTDEKERQEHEKDPQYRLERFQRNAHKPTTGMATSGNTRTSGSFGGAPKTLRTTGGSAKRKDLAVPAWMLGEGGEDG